MSSLTIPEAAQRLDISVTAVRDWLEIAGSEKRTDSRGRRRIDAETMAILETVKNLRADDHGYETIRRRISPLSESRVLPESESSEISQRAESATMDGEHLVSQVIAAIGAQTDLAEKYARAAHQIGSLENEVKHLTALAESLKSENEEQRIKIQLLEAPKEPAQQVDIKRPWWRPWG